MKKERKNAFRFILPLALITVMALLMAACSQNAEPKTEDTKSEVESQNSGKEETILGEGETEFLFSVVGKEGGETKFRIRTREKTVGAALLSLQLISGEAGEYGLYVKTVNGITLDYEADGYYWSFYDGDNYALKGVDQTEIVPGAAYTLKAEKS